MGDWYLHTIFTSRREASYAATDALQLQTETAALVNSVSMIKDSTEVAYLTYALSAIATLDNNRTTQLANVLQQLSTKQLQS